MRDRPQPIPEDVASFQAIEQENNSFLQLLEERGALQRIDGRMVFDPEGIKSLMRRDKAGKYWEKSMDLEQVKAGLAGLKGYTKSDLNNPDFQSGRLPPREVLPLPEDLASIPHRYSEAASRAVVNVWDLEPNVKWTREIVLSSGQKTNVAELFIANELQDRFKARRNNKGELEIFDQTENRYKQFSAGLFHSLSGRRMTVTQEGQTFNFNSNPLLFTEKFLPNLLQTGILRREDFRTTRGSRTTEIFNVHERKLNPKAPFVTLGSGDKTMKYYIGRDKIVGTDAPADENTKIRLLDNNTAGIIQDRYGKKRLLYTFKLLSPDEIDEKRKAVDANYSSKGRRLEGGEITQRTSVNASEMQGRIAKYDITQFVPKHADETAEQYAKRVADLNDVDFVTKKFQGFFAEAGIGVHDLPWSEQLILANAITEEKDRNRLIRFAKQFGIEGLRSFLASDYDPKMTGVVLVLGEQSPDAAKSIFSKYNQIIDEAKKVSDYLVEQFRQKSEEVSAENLNRIKENLLRRAKEFLVKFSSRSQGQELKLESITAELEGIRSEVVLFAAVFRDMLKNPDFSVKDFIAKSIQIKDSSQLSDEDRSEMIKVFEAGRRENNYPESLQQESVASFKKLLTERGHEFTLLVHDGHIVSFIRADHLPTGEIYLGSYNLRQETKGTPLAVILAKDRIEHYGEEHDLVADAYEGNPAVPYYTRILGFKIVERIENHKGRGQTYVKLFRPKMARSEQALQAA
ncbi:MAG: hypothetical protein HYV13_02555 [Candidatus Doudnabacteria bacterium]|nr:hypothetical protein [Candidatus Doudnabacteria bacterium]